MKISLVLKFQLLVLTFSIALVANAQDVGCVNYAEPDCTNGSVLIEHSGFTISFIDEYKHAEWVSYTLIGRKIDSANFKRTEKFVVDPKHNNCAKNSDYNKSGYDRGHLFPAANAWSKVIMDESFYYTNMSPQEPSFNRGIWKRMETKVRDWASEYDTVYVVTGAYLTANLQTIGDGVVIPSYYYKAILVNTQKTQQAIAFFVRNTKSDSKKLENFVVSIDVLELITGLDFFINLDLDLQNELEKEVDLAKWKW